MQYIGYAVNAHGFAYPGGDADGSAGQRFQEAGHVAAGVDDPFGAAGLQIANERLLEMATNTSVRSLLDRGR